MRLNIYLSNKQHIKHVNKLILTYYTNNNNKLALSRSSVRTEVGLTVVAHVNDV